METSELYFCFCERDSTLGLERSSLLEVVLENDADVIRSFGCPPGPRLVDLADGIGVKLMELMTSQEDKPQVDGLGASG